MPSGGIVVAIQTGGLQYRGELGTQ